MSLFSGLSPEVTIIHRSCRPEKMSLAERIGGPRMSMAGPWVPILASCLPLPLKVKVRGRKATTVAFGCHGKLLGKNKQANQIFRSALNQKLLCFSLASASKVWHVVLSIEKTMWDIDTDVYLAAENSAAWAHEDGGPNESQRYIRFVPSILPWLGSLTWWEFEARIQIHRAITTLAIISPLRCMVGGSKT